VTHDEAIKEVITAFKRAKIEFVRFATNEPSEMELWRAIYHGKGTREGRRLGGASIKRVLWQAESDAILAADDNAKIEIEATTEAEKAIIKAYFRLIEECKVTGEPPNVPKSIQENFNAETGEGRAILENDEMMALLVGSQLYLEGSAKLTDKMRDAMRATSADWQTAISDNPEITSVLGVHAFGTTTPEEVQRAFNDWLYQHLGVHGFLDDMTMENWTFSDCDLSEWQRLDDKGFVLDGRKG